MVDIVIAKATGSPWSKVLGHPEGHLNGQDRRTFGPWHLSLGANIGFAFEFLRRTDRENRGDPLRPEIAASRRSRGADVRPCLFPLFVYPGTGKGGAQRVRTHNPTSFPPKFAARSGSLRWKAMASSAGETVGLLSGSCSPGRLAQAATRRSRACGPSLGKAVAHHGLSSASLSPPSDLTCSRKASEQPAQTLMRANLLLEAACHALEA